MKRAKDQSQLLSAMKSVGIAVNGYKRNPIYGNNGFAISSVGNGKSIMIFYNPKKSTINYETSSKHKQIVLSVFEAKRTISSERNFWRENIFSATQTKTTKGEGASKVIFDKIKLGITKKDKQDVVLSKLRKNFTDLVNSCSTRSFRNFSLPSDVKQKMNRWGFSKQTERLMSEMSKDLSWMDSQKDLMDGAKKFDIFGTQKWIGNAFSIKIFTDALPTNLNLLVGKDETHFFASVLPKRVSTVESAHAILRPKEAIGVRGVVRQGEFFYVPVTNKTLKNQLNKMNSTIAMAVNTIGLNSILAHAARSSMIIQDRHIGTDTRRIGGSRYVRGAVYHSGGHHKTIFLKDWHKVVRNNEKAMPESASKQKTID